MEHRRIKKVMSKKVITVTPRTNIYKVALLMKKHNTNAVIVKNKQKISGIISERDIVREVIIKNKDYKKTLAEEMTKKVISVSPEADFIPTVELMKRRKVRQFPIVDKKKILGIVTEDNLLNGFTKIIKNLDWELVNTKIKCKNL